MKNIHVLPTEHTSRLYYNANDKTWQLCEFPKYHTDIKSTQNICITSDEEIKDGDYGICLNLVREGFKSHQAVFKMDAEQRQAMEELGGQKKAEVLKIILTTDQDLIKDGVQAIDDDFLEWFVKNPSCEEVEVTKIQYNPVFDEDDLSYDGMTAYYNYKIIIPRTNQQIIDEDYAGGLDMGQITSKEKPKQETLKEAVVKYYENNIDESNIPREHYEWEIQYLMIGFAYQWQQEQDKNKFSDEETFDLMNKYAEDVVVGCNLRAKKWFEQFKNK